MMEWIIERASSYAAEIDWVIFIVAILGGFWLLVAEGVLLYFVCRYRRRAGVPALYVTGEKKEEMKWIHWPNNIIILCDIVIIVFAVKAWYTVKQDLPAADETIRIVGRQWAWKFTHPGLDGKLGTADDVDTIDELHVKAGVTYHFKLESDDVLHSFSVPVFRLKQDAVPGRVITGWFKPTRTGTFDIQCAEMCGIGHGIMGARIHIETAEEHGSWLRTRQAVPARTSGSAGTSGGDV